MKINLYERVHIDGKTRVLSDWIQEDPMLIYSKVYEPVKNNMQSMRLTNDGIALLKQVLLEKHPEVYKNMKSRNLARVNTKGGTA